jgi:adenylate cyclase class IV
VRNLEFKAPLSDPLAATRTARELGFELWGDLRQTDTYFAVPAGRLKLRETPGLQAELVFYERDELAAGRPSEYQVVYTPDAALMRDLLSAALGVLGIVRKRRTLLLLDSVRIHLDNVEELGQFIEIEAPVRREADEAAVSVELDRLIKTLGFEWEDCIRASYLDMKLGKASAEIST